MKKRLIILRSIIIVILLFILTLTSCQSKKKNNLIGNDIVFAVTADSSILDSTEFKYDLNELENQIDTDSSYVYLNPKKTDYKIVEKFGFDINDYETRDSGERYYEILGSDKEVKLRLEIDEFGCFTYYSNISYKRNIEFKFTRDETIKMARDYLVKYGLWNDDLLDEKNVSFNEAATISFQNEKEKRTVFGKGVNFFAQKVDGRGIAGNSRVSVEITSLGELREIYYNIREYEDRQEVELISLDEAIRDIRDNDAFIEVESVSDKLIFRNVHLSYWTQNRNEENLIMQPVYVFSGISITSDGSEEPFSITVQANRLS